MTIDEFRKSIGWPEMKVFAKHNGFIWYCVKNPKKGATGVPMMIREDTRDNSFEILDSDQVFAAMEFVR